jgi:ubiquitin-like-conjugating enzyme ATG3
MKQNKTPLTPTQVFQDVPSDYAFKTMTMEAFPHSGAQLASVHPCKHASVMKKFIDRMESAQAQGEVPTPPGSSEKGGKKKWGLGGMVRRVTGGPGSAGEKDKEVKKESSDSSADESQGLQVDFYLVIVSYRSRYFEVKLMLSS